ncbi:MAG: hypothetical protein II936_08590 [Oscillospiraceae bacterium]|nr:hypothetical protein [Oscillospiraceae bacterium]
MKEFISKHPVLFILLLSVPITLVITVLLVIFHPSLFGFSIPDKYERISVANSNAKLIFFVTNDYCTALEEKSKKLPNGLYICSLNNKQSERVEPETGTAEEYSRYIDYMLGDTEKQDSIAVMIHDGRPEYAFWSKSQVLCETDFSLKLSAVMENEKTDWNNYEPYHGIFYHNAAVGGYPCRFVRNNDKQIPDLQRPVTDVYNMSDHRQVDRMIIPDLRTLWFELYPFGMAADVYFMTAVLGIAVHFLTKKAKTKQKE